jgi:hypothetical protein
MHTDADADVIFHGTQLSPLRNGDSGPSRTLVSPVLAGGHPFQSGQHQGRRSTGAPTSNLTGRPGGAFLCTGVAAPSAQRRFCVDPRPAAEPVIIES